MHPGTLLRSIAADTREVVEDTVRSMRVCRDHQYHIDTDVAVTSPHLLPRLFKSGHVSSPHFPSLPLSFFFTLTFVHRMAYPGHKSIAEAFWIRISPLLSLSLGRFSMLEHGSASPSYQKISHKCEASRNGMEKTVAMGAMLL